MVVGHGLEADAATKAWSEFDQGGSRAALLRSL
jgi:hypothetical protein